MVADGDWRRCVCVCVCVCVYTYIHVSACESDEGDEGAMLTYSTHTNSNMQRDRHPPHIYLCMQRGRIGKAAKRESREQS